MYPKKNIAINRITDDWLLVYPNTYKADLLSALSKFDEQSVEEIYSFHDRIREFPADEKRQILENLPKDYQAEIQNMLEAYAGAMEAQALNQPTEDRNIELLQVSLQDIREHLARLGS